MTAKIGRALPIALLIALAGCLGGAGGEITEPAAIEDGAGEPLESFAELFVVKTCPHTYLAILWPIDELQAHLPEGFVAGDFLDAGFGALTPHYVPDRVDGDATPLGMILVWVVICEGDDDPRTHYKEVLTGIAIEAPEVADVHGAASVEFYLAEHVVSTPWFAEMMTPIGWEFTQDVVIEGAVHEDLAPSGVGGWSDAAGTGYHAEIAAPTGSPGIPFKDVVYRHWQAVPEGIAYFDHLATGKAVLAPDFSCTIREGTALHDMLGRTDCAHPDATYFPYVISGHDPTLSFHYLHGATVA